MFASLLKKSLPSLMLCLPFLLAEGIAGPALAQTATPTPDTFETNPDLPVPASVPRRSTPFGNRVYLYSSQVKTLGSSVKDFGGGVKDFGSKLKNLASANKNITVTEGTLDYTISLNSDVLFDFDKATLRPEAEQSLGDVAKALNDAKVKTISLTGHTDSKGDDDYNLKLSLRRADSVAKWFKDKGGLSASKFRVAGEGERKPVAPNTKPDGSDDPEGRQKNRRVDISVNK